MAKRPRRWDGIRVLPRTRTSRVPGGGGQGVIIGLGRGGGGQTIAGFVEAVVGVAVAGEDDDFVAALLKADGGVDDESLGAADAEVGVQKDYGLFLGILFVLFAGGRHGDSVRLSHVSFFTCQP